MYQKPKCSSFDELEILKEQIKEKAVKQFDGLISKLNINREKNTEWSHNYYSLVKETDKLRKSVKRLSVWKWVLLIPLIFPFFILNSAQKKKEPILAAKTKELETAKNNLQKQLSEFRHKLTYDLAYNEIIASVWKDIKLDLFMDWKSASNWEHDYFQYMPESSCATSLVSGSLFEHPFVLMNRKDQTWYTQIYTGTMPVTYTVYRDGRSEMRTDMAVATVALPAPAWSYSPYFLYRTSKPYELTFCNDLSNGQFKKKIKKFQQTNMDNPEFDKVFKASRNDEKDYRVVFTPLAQEGFVELFKTRKYSIEKELEVTSISTPIPLVDNDFSDDVNYNLDEWKNKYVDWICRLVNHLGVFSLPIANMPVYYQMEYKEHSGEKISRLHAQDLANWIVNRYGLDGAFETDVVYECKSYRDIEVEKHRFTCIQIKCNYFHPNHRVEIVPTPSRGGIVNVPVPVIDYFERSKDLFIYVCNDIKDLSDTEIATNNWAIHSGQLVLWSWTTIDLNRIIQAVKETK